MQNDSRNSTQASTSSEGSLDLNTNVILRVECISRSSLKKFVIVQFVLHWASVSLWVCIAALAYRKSLFRQQKVRDLHMNTAISALSLTAALLMLSTLVYFVVRVSRAQQKWTQSRGRLVWISVYQLTCLIVATASFFAASCYVSIRGCNSISHFCIWCFFVQWTAWNTLLFAQLLMTHSACVWTDGQAKPQRRLMMHLSPWLRHKPKNAMILEAPWMIHTPKFLLWLVIEATIVIQLVISLQGRTYRPHAVDLGCHGSLADVCVKNNANRAAIITRCVAISLAGLWHMVLVFQGLRDMARMPVDSFRMGRILIRMVSSSQVSTGSTLLPFISLVVATLQSRCLSCQPNYIILGLLVSCTVMLGLGSFLIHPKSRSTDDDILMQVWLQRFAWTEQKLAACKRKRDALPQDPTLLRDEPMFCFETAVKLLYWAGFVYEHEEGRKVMDRTEETAMKLYNLEQVEVIRDPLTSTKCLVAWGPDTILVAFRGTANRQNAALDVKAWLVPHIPETGAKTGCGLGPTAAVHSGFSLSWETALKEAVYAALKRAVMQSGQDASCLCVYVTGHSLGGAMAVLAAFDIADLYPWGSLQVYTVGAPRPGNATFAAQYNAKVPHTWHVINPQDPIPKVGKFWGLFSRPGQRVLVNPRGDMQVRPTPLDRRLTPLSPVHMPFLQRLHCSKLPCCMMAGCLRSVNSHYLTSYRASLVSIVQAELKRPRFEEGLEGVLDLASSISLEDTLAAADLAANASGRSLNTTAAVVSSVEDLITDAASLV
ncbi:hypothetical protein ABBQ32_011423 [Trebouxia sp. C0010 RCD-2024]